MARVVSYAGVLVAGAVGGYVVGRRRQELVSGLGRLRGTRARGSLRELEEEREIAHNRFVDAAERERVERHRIAEEMKSHPLRPRERKPRRKVTWSAEHAAEEHLYPPSV